MDVLKAKEEVAKDIKEIIHEAQSVVDILNEALVELDSVFDVETADAFDAKYDEKLSAFKHICVYNEA